MEQILEILHIYLPYEICLKILFQYKGYQSMTCRIIKPFINKCQQHITREAYHKNIKYLDLQFIKPKLNKIIILKHNNNIIYNSRLQFRVKLTSFYNKKYEEMITYL